MPESEDGTRTKYDKTTTSHRSKKTNGDREQGPRKETSVCCQSLGLDGVPLVEVKEEKDSQKSLPNLGRDFNKNKSKNIPLKKYIPKTKKNEKADILSCVLDDTNLRCKNREV